MVWIAVRVNVANSIDNVCLSTKESDQITFLTSCPKLTVSKVSVINLVLVFVYFVPLKDWTLILCQKLHLCFADSIYGFQVYNSDVGIHGGAAEAV